MPGPKFSASKVVRPSWRAKRFTLAQANSTLPLVRKIVADIVRVHASAIALHNEFGSAKPKDQQIIQDRLEDMQQIVGGYVEELHEIGCEIKDHETGLLDFIGRHRGHDVCLCWRLGEDQIQFWHELSAGVAGRQPVSTLQEDQII